MVPLPPTGIQNTNSNCWANSLLQMIANSPYLATKILGYRNTPALKPVAKALQAYYQGQIEGRDVAQIDSEALRQWAISRNTASSLHGDEDPYAPFVDILEVVKNNSSLTQTYTENIYGNDGHLIFSEDPRTTVRKSTRSRSPSRRRRGPRRTGTCSWGSPRCWTGPSTRPTFT